jgi:hypothetical protein
VDVFINYITPLIGDYPYCFVAIGIRNFRDAYVTMFPDETSYIEFATVQDAKIYCDKKLHDATTNQCMLCEKVAQKGNLTVLMYLRSIGCSWDEWTCAHAAENGHLDVLQWCIQNGCPWDRYTCAFAAKNGHGKNSFAGIGSPMVEIAKLLPPPPLPCGRIYIQWRYSPNIFYHWATWSFGPYRLGRLWLVVVGIETLS